MNERTYQVVIGILIVIIIFLGWWIMAHPSVPVSSMGTTSTLQPSGAASNSGTTVKPTTSTPTSGSTSGTTSGSPSTTSMPSMNGETISVANQAASQSVMVASVSFTQPGWVAVRDSDGRTLGAAWFDKGAHTAVSVPLLRGTTAGGSYQVLLYADDGDKQFDLHKDVLMMTGGAVAGATFKAQ